MDLIDQMQQLSKQVNKLSGTNIVKTEEGTKNALVMPFIAALGYNVFDPAEVTPEFDADVGTKKGEKVDYAILKDGKPIMLFECKVLGAELDDVHASQLYRYFSVTEAKFGVLTNGAQYYFFSDLVALNKMDAKPFFVFDLLNLSESAVRELKGFAKSQFDADSVKSTASDLKYKREIVSYLSEQLKEPSDDFVQFLMKASKAYTGRFTEKIKAENTSVVQGAFQQFMDEQVNTVLKSASALVRSRDGQDKATESSDQPSKGQETPSNASGIVTTEMEREAFDVIRAILREIIDVHRIVMRDQKSYCGILLDDNNRKPLARLYFDGKKKAIGLFDGNNPGERVTIETVEDIFNLADRLKAQARSYDG